MNPRRSLSLTSLDLSSAFRTVFFLFGFGRFLPLHELSFLDSLTMAIHPNVAGQFKPFGSANSCPQSIHSKAWYRLASAKKFTTVEYSASQRGDWSHRGCPPRKDGGLLKPLSPLLWAR